MECGALRIPKVKAVLLAPSLAMTTIHVTTMKTTSQNNLSQRLGSNRLRHPRGLYLGIKLL